MTFREYTATAKAALRVPRESSPRLVWKFMYNFGWKSMRNISRFEKRQAKGAPFFPAFVMISVTESCNLACSGCWVTEGGRRALTNKQLDSIITSCKKKGSYFFGILGGEPLMYKELLSILEGHPDCYFQLFTNGVLLTDEVARRLKKMGNVTPLISIEGLKEESDARRGKNDVFERTLAGVRACRKAKLIFGVAASICKSNYNDLVNREYIELLAKEGVHYLWYYLYRPVGANPNPDNALDKEQVLAFRRFIVEQRRDAPLFIIETYWDDKGNALCPGATGMSHHISPSGAVEFCPPIQMAIDYVNGEGSNLVELFENSTFLADFRKMTAESSRGCILLEDPQKMVEFLEKHQAIDGTSRGNVLEEYKKMAPSAGHNQEGQEIPEENIFYKLVKKKYFFGFGAYG
ncbi:MoaA/NifB/PqqE/SkfB family radical SAM enzyme [Parabacteroides sp. PF5-5]|uniref:radical SAM protein n=1 Tax=unclassified Parabacteroides TaxID=2649774 RepID=UPI00247515F0|nr:MULTISPECIES: radical SAM protein [unclassified Parabacteroides]MDH6303743.1 MoaA/NifB/PqqE/SkfB family radical SAM enzyme [Parabacteroides sp. PH5-39]MDH6314360.1 MoaA/NifB/PqqE/SkfB family radical SAM enzyme [Parabacteroides sp. PF5-13]MDH6318575.1 MoaA/NifB/PqqE/SkfB family radical SAM enzyme [Parabacteroides sp. PH5-13]MDH6322132.1 MoaA/NifB/PqqE/SkfB family radical SAM enzyme [Parabacteroides sp. PH5-8]MDH6325788.1 MoaA/NifB/PqqE/SkfB family radical SAM enzyme [Parabacteroides sp. PH5-